MASSEEPTVYDNWEDLEASGALEKRLEKMESPAPKNGERTSYTQPSEFQVTVPEESRAKYNLPPEPVVKILKRPSQCKNSSMGGGDGLLLDGDASKPRVAIKTLQQREEEYAQARLRILGEAQSPEEDLTQEENVSVITNKFELLPRPNPISRLNNKDSEEDEGRGSEGKPQIDHWNSNSHYVPSNIKLSCNLSNSVLASTKTNSSNSHNPNSIVQLKSDESPQLVRNSEPNVIRHPRGPDDSNGFVLRR